MAKEPTSLGAAIDSYCATVAQGEFPRAYRGILAQLTQFQSGWEQAHPIDNVGALYPGYLDMSFVAFAPAELAKKNLKISLVFLHDSGTFTLWLIARNRTIQKRVSEALRAVPLGKYTRTVLEPGVDAIIESALDKPYAFDDPAVLTARLISAAEAFAGDMIALVATI